jgi:hypothetical protein
MKIPNKIKVAGHQYKIIIDDKGLSKKGIVGEYSCNSKEIKLCKHFQSKRAMAKSEVEATLIHEIIHAIDIHYNNHSLSEKETSRLGEGLYQVLTDNFKLETRGNYEYKPS